MSTDNWERVTRWQLVLPPSRPDQLELKRIASLSRNILRDAPVAVLGSTPEFRDLLAELNFTSVHVFDRNAEFNAAMTLQRTQQSPEVLVLGDWNDTLSRYGSTFHLILSDLTSGNVPYEQRAAFYGTVAQALAPGGIFIDKYLDHDSGLLSLTNIGRRFRRLPLNLRTINDFSCEALFCSELQVEYGLVDTAEFYSRLRVEFRHTRIARFVEDAINITPEGCIWYYGARQAEMAAAYSRCLRLQAKYGLIPGQPYHGRAHQYVWTRAFPGHTATHDERTDRD